MFRLQIDESSPIPKHRQISEQFRAAILTGLLKPGEKLPTQAEFRDKWNVHIVTLAKAMGPLEREGLVIAQVAKGRFVADRLPKMSEANRRTRLVDAAKTFAIAVSSLGYSESVLIAEIRKHLQRGSKR